MLEESQVKFHHRKTFLELQSETVFQHSPKQWGLKSKKQTNQKKKRQKQNKHKMALYCWAGVIQVSSVPQ